LVNQVVREGMGPRRPAGSADEYGVPIAEDMNVRVYVNARHPYAAFFERRFKSGVRSFPKEPNIAGAFAEARYFAWDKLRADQDFPIKGHSLSAADLLGNTERARPFIGGPVILAGLAPVDYHHLHYFDDGDTLEHDSLGNRLWTVNRNALRNQPDILFRNERKVHILLTKNFGRVGFAEIGALSVGRIVQKHPLDRPFQRGSEKSVFRFGGSAVISSVNRALGCHQEISCETRSRD
jgi:phosphatidylserine decarboxylase